MQARKLVCLVLMLLAGCAHQDILESLATARVETLDLGEIRYGFISDLATDRKGNLYVSGPGIEPGTYTLLKITPDGAMSSIPGTYWNPVMGVSDDGVIYIANTYGDFGGPYNTKLYRLDGRAEAELISEQFDRVQALKVDPRGRLLILRTNQQGNHNQIFRWDPRTRRMSLLAGSAEPVEGVKFTELEIVDGKGTDAVLGFANGFIVDTAGNVLTTDVRGNLRKVTPAGEVTTLRNYQVATVSDLEVDDSGTLYLFNGTTVRKSCANGQLTELAGFGGNGNSALDGNGYVARFRNIVGGARDRRGTLYVADMDISTMPWEVRVRKIVFDAERTEPPAGMRIPDGPVQSVPIGANASVRDNVPAGQLGVQGFPSGVQGIPGGGAILPGATRTAGSGGNC